MFELFSGFDTNLLLSQLLTLLAWIIVIIIKGGTNMRLVRVILRKVSKLVVHKNGLAMLDRLSDDELRALIQGLTTIARVSQGIINVREAYRNGTNSEEGKEVKHNG